MHRTETESLSQCVDCGAEVSLTLDRTYRIDEERGLCFACAIRRGGNYDELHDRWTRAPDLTGFDQTAFESSRLWRGSSRAP